MMGCTMPPTTTDAMDASEHRQMARKHVFCVNGAPAFLDILRELFQDEHYNVTTTNFVPNTQDMIEALRPDLVLVDLEVGLRAGWELLEALTASAATAGMPVVITSTDARLLDTAEADPTRYGGQAHLVKPLDIEELLRIVQGLIGTP
jgi:CheY-like chemotaxis protein